MKKIIKTLIKIIASIILLIFIVSILLTAFLDINQYKTEISDLVAQETGLNLDIKGDLNLTLFSGLKFSANDIKLSHGKEIIADIQSLQLGISLNSIYIGEPEITSVELHIKNLNLHRDKKNNFNFLPLYDSQKNQSDKAENFSLSHLAINNIKLFIDKFHYRDDLESVSVKLNQVDTSLSFLPIIDHYELVIDDPRVLVGYNYMGKLKLKQAFINQYQFVDLSLAFSDKKGDFIADKLVFSFIQGGEKHAPPPLIFDADGKLSFKLMYHTPEGALEPDWLQPDVVQLGTMDFNLPKLKISDKEFWLETENAHIKLHEIAIFESNKFVLNELIIKSLVFDGKTINFKIKKEDEYHLNQFSLKLNHIPVLHKGQSIDFRSELFLQKFAKKGLINFTSKSLLKKSEALKNIKLLITGKNKLINLETLSVFAIDSEINAKGGLTLSTDKKKTLSKWQLDISSNKLNLQPLSELMNMPSVLEGYVAVDTHLSGDLQQLEFKIKNGVVKTTAKDIVLNGMDVNKVLEDFQSSQSVGLLDIGAVALLGPAGVLVTKGNDYNKLMNSFDNKGTSHIKQLNSEIKFSDGIASMNDVAFSTDKHRLAATGQINAINQTFVNFNVATIDKHGCPIYREEVKGSLDSPSVKKVNVLVSSVVNPINSLISKVTKPLNIQCKEPFYAGVVKAP